jgi:hypothetical protein
MTPLHSFGRDDAGSITIVTLFVILGLLLSLASITHIYLTEKQFAELERVQIQHHSLHQMTYQLVLNQVTLEEPPSLTGQFIFPNGSTTYSITQTNNLTLLYINSRTSHPFNVRHYYTLPEATSLFNEP